MSAALLISERGVDLLRNLRHTQLCGMAVFFVNIFQMDALYTVMRAGKIQFLHKLRIQFRIDNPGHDIEGVWFLLEHAKNTADADLVAKAEEIFAWAMAAGWDEEYGGLLSFVDALGLPPEVCEHDMKLWWPHNEILIASLMLYRDTGKEEYLVCFYRVLEYAKAHFSDPEYGEWYGYLRRDGKPTEPSTKGTTFKGPFHLPRMLSMLDGMLTELQEKAVQ